MYIPRPFSLRVLNRMVQGLTNFPNAVLELISGLQSTSLPPSIPQCLLFYRQYRRIAEEATPHIYLSALPFVSKNSSFGTGQFSGLVTGFPSEVVHNAVRSFYGHERVGFAVAISPNGQRIVSGSEDGTLCVWDVASGAQIGSSLRQHKSAINTVAFSHNGYLFVSGSRDCTVCLWYAETGNLIGKPLRHQNSVHAVAFSPDDLNIASGSLYEVLIWDTLTRTKIGQPFLSRSMIRKINFSPDGQKIVSTLSDFTVIIWDFSTRMQIKHPFIGHTRNITAVSFVPDGQHIVTSSHDHTIRIWDVATGTQSGSPLEGHSFYVSGAVVLSDCSTIVSSSYDSTVRLWSMDTRAPIGQPITFHGPIIAMSCDGQRVVCLLLDGTMQLCDISAALEDEEPPRIYHGKVYSASFSPDGQAVVSSLGDQVVLWDIKTGSPLGGLVHRGGVVNSACFSFDGCYIVSSSSDGTIAIWDVGTYKQVNTLIGHKRAVNSALFSPDAKLVVSCSDDSTIRVWNADTGTLIGAPLVGHSLRVTTVSISPNGEQIASGSFDCTLRLWDVRTLSQVWESKGSKESISSVSWSPDGRYIVSGSVFGPSCLWEVTSRLEVDKVHIFPSAINSTSFSSDGKLLALAGKASQEVVLWSTATRTELQYLRDHQGKMNTISFSSDGSSLVSGSNDGTIRMWKPSESTDAPTNVSNCPFGLVNNLFINAQQPWLSSHFDRLSGWIQGPHGELLFWVPQQYRDMGMLWLPEHTGVLGREEVKIQWHNSVHGLDWASCYVGRQGWAV